MSRASRCDTLQRDHDRPTIAAESIGGYSPSATARLRPWALAASAGVHGLALIALSALSAGTAVPVPPARTAGLTLVNLTTPPPPAPTRSPSPSPAPAKVHAVTDRIAEAAPRPDTPRSAMIPPAAPTAPAVPLAQPAQTSAPPPPAAAPALRDQSGYTALLWQRIAAHRPAGIELAGSALVEFRLDRTGHLVSTRIARSSGIVLLDRLALRAVKDAAPFPPPPADLADADLAFTVPVNFH